MIDLTDITNSHIRNTIEEYIHSRRDRSIMVDRYIEGYTFEMIAERHDMSTVQIKRIIYKNEDALLKHL